MLIEGVHADWMLIGLVLATRWCARSTSAGGWVGEWVGGWVCMLIEGMHADGMLIGACNPMVCPIHVCRLISQLLHFGGTTQSNVGKKVDECQPLLGIFGNSRTRFNNNSSRFGKFIEIVYDGPAIGYARVKHYLLEKSRVSRTSKTLLRFLRSTPPHTRRVTGPS